MDRLLGDEVDAAIGDPLEHALALVGLEIGAEHLAVLVMAGELTEKGRGKHHLVEPLWPAFNEPVPPSPHPVGAVQLA